VKIIRALRCPCWSAFFLLTFVAISSSSAQSQVEPSKVPHFSIEPKDLYAAASSIDAPEDASVAIMERDCTVSFDSQGRMVKTDYAVYKILSLKGAQRSIHTAIRWEPWHEARPEIRVRVITPDHAEHWLAQNMIIEAPAREGDYKIYSNTKRLLTSLPAISPGAVVELEYIQREAEPLFSAGRVGGIVLGVDSQPIAHSRIEIDAPKEFSLRTDTLLLNNAKPERTESKGQVKLVFQVNHLEGSKSTDSNLPPDEVSQPDVLFSTGASWQVVATEYSKLVDGHLNPAAVKPIVDKLIEGKSSVEAKEIAILDYLNREVRYTGIAIGDAAIVPHDSAETLSKKYGDSRDKAILLVTMLRAAHIPAYVALLDISSRVDVPSELPGMGLFSHAIVYVPGARPTEKTRSASPDLWIDATDKYARLGQLPMVDQGRLALIVRPETTALVKIPESTSKDNILSERYEVNLSDDGPSSIAVKYRPKGVFEDNIRRLAAEGADKDFSTSLANYVKNQCLSDKITVVKRSDPTDLSLPFEASLVCEKASRGYTNMFNASAGIRTESLFVSLPLALKELQKNEQNKDSLAKPRTADWFIDEPYQVDWNYRIVPPAGFVPKQLQKDLKIALGASVLTESFSAESNGTVLVHVNFDTVKRRYTVAEATELRNKMAGMITGPAIVVQFEPEAEVLLREGKAREALASYRNLAALHPGEAIHRMQIAKTLIRMGMGESARAEAREAVRLEPTSVSAHKLLADVLVYDLVGRNMRAGSDLAGAVEALRAAVRLDPDDIAAQGNLATLLSYDSVGRSRSPQGHLKEAIADYEKIGKSKLMQLGFQGNLAYDLFAMGDYSGALKTAEALPHQPVPLIVASVGALQGSKAGLAAASSRARDEASFRQLVQDAGQMLINARLYSVAADFVEAGASGDSAVQLRARAALLRMTKRREELQLTNSPRDLVQKFLLSAMDPNSKEEKMNAFLSRNAKAISEGQDPKKKIYGFVNGKQMNSHLARQGYSFDEIADVAMVQSIPIIEGDDKTGYRVQVRLPFMSGPSVQFVKSTFFVVKESGEYKLLDSDDDPNSIALEMLDRIDRGDLKGAKVLLDRLRLDIPLEGGDDALEGPVFPRFWTEGQAADAIKMKLAAASILASSKPSAAKGISILEEALKTASSEQEKMNIELALATAYSSLGDYTHLHAMAAALLAQAPASQTAFMNEVMALIGLKRFDDALQLADARLKLLKDDPDALRAKERIELGRYNYTAAHAWAQKLSDHSSDDAVQFNAAAWLALFTGHVDDRDLAQSLKAAQIWHDASDILNTVASLYAEVGKLREAQETLARSMDLADADEPREKDWYVLGRIAEQLGERDVAIADYRKLKRPTDPMTVPQSSYSLAQLRLKILGMQSGAAGN